MLVLVSRPARPEDEQGALVKLEALNEELLGFLDAHFGGLLDVWVHEFGEPVGVDWVLIDGVELRQDAAQNRPHHIGWQPRDSVSLEQTLRQ
jgi:hypothetical protein